MLSNSIKSGQEMQSKYFESLGKFGEMPKLEMPTNLFDMSFFQIGKTQMTDASIETLKQFAAGIDAMIENSPFIENKSELIADFNSKKYGEMDLKDALADINKSVVSFSTGTFNFTDMNDIMKFDWKESVNKTNASIINNLLISKEAVLSKIKEFEGVAQEESQSKAKKKA